MSGFQAPAASQIRRSMSLLRRPKEAAFQFHQAPSALPLRLLVLTLYSPYAALGIRALCRAQTMPMAIGLAFGQALRRILRA